MSSFDVNATKPARHSAHAERLERLSRHLSPPPPPPCPSAAAAVTVEPSDASPAFPTVRQYLERIGLSEVYPPPQRPPPTEDTLRTLHAAHQLAVPFENFGGRAAFSFS